MPRRRRPPARRVGNLRLTRLGAVLCLLTLLAGAAALTGAAAYYRTLQARAAHWVAVGEPVEATVVAAGNPRHTASYLEVRYRWDGESQQRRLYTLGATARYELEDPVALYVNPAAPEQVATEDRYLSEPRWLVNLWYPLLIAGVLLLTTGGWMLWTAFRESRPPRWGAG